MNVALARKLRVVAAQRRTITYGEVARPLGLDMSWPPDRDTIAGVLGDISVHEHLHGRPLLTAVVVLAETGWPGGGFFDLGRSTGRMAAHEDHVVFFARELAAVHDYWAARRKGGTCARLVVTAAAGATECRPATTSPARAPAPAGTARSGPSSAPRH